MIDLSATYPMRGVGENPLCAWGRFLLVPDDNPVTEHAFGVSLVHIAEGQWTARISPDVRPRFWVPLVSVLGSDDVAYVTSFDEKKGTFVIVGREPPGPPTPTGPNVYVNVCVIGGG